MSEVLLSEQLAPLRTSLESFAWAAAQIGLRGFALKGDEQGAINLLFLYSHGSKRQLLEEAEWFNETLDASDRQIVRQFLGVCQERGDLEPLTLREWLVAKIVHFCSPMEPSASGDQEPPSAMRASFAEEVFALNDFVPVLYEIIDRLAPTIGRIRGLEADTWAFDVKAKIESLKSSAMRFHPLDDSPTGEPTSSEFCSFVEEILNECATLAFTETSSAKHGQGGSIPDFPLNDDGIRHRTNGKQRSRTQKLLLERFRSEWGTSNALPIRSLANDAKVTRDAIFKALDSLKAEFDWFARCYESDTGRAGVRLNHQLLNGGHDEH